jgi:hypothetical protein
MSSRFRIFASSLSLKTYFTNFMNLDVSMVIGFPEFPSTPPLCDFIQWLDTEQSDLDKSYVEGETRDARERRLCMVEWEKRMEKKEEQKEMRHHQEMREREVAQAREADRERKRERARRAKAAGPDAIRKGKYPRCTQ